MANRSFKIYLALILGIGMPNLCFATGGDRIPGSRFVSGRGAALGDAYIGLAEGVAESLFYNPAGLGRLTGFSAEPLNIGLQGNAKLVSGFGSDIYKIQDLSNYETNLQAQPGTSPGAAFSVLPAFGFHGLGFGVLYQSRLMAEVNGTNLRYRSNYQLIPALGYGFKLASGVLRMGYSLQWVNQASGDKTVPVGTRPLSWGQGVSEGKGFSHTFGMAVTLPYQFQPTINVVARNIAGTRFSGTTLVGIAENPTGTIAEETMSIDGSLGFLTKISAGWNLGTQFAYRDAMNSSNTRMISHVAAGLEFTAVDRFFIRAGYGSGYPSAGLGIKTSRADVNFAWFSEDLGDGATPQRDIRYLFQFVFRAL